MIELNKVSKTYQMGNEKIHALRELSLTIKAGEFVAIMGPSGSGKSTLMHILGLLDVPDSGSYRLLDREVSHLKEDQLAVERSQTIGFVFQQFNLLTRTTALDNVRLPELYANRTTRRVAAEDLLTQVGLGSRLNHRPNELSGGQQQRVAIARSLANSPRLILADEPTGNLDSASGAEILAVLRQLNAQGITVILVTHEPEVAEHAKRIIRMRDGRIYSDEISPAKTSDLPMNTAVPNMAALGPESMFHRFRALFLLDIHTYFQQALLSLLRNKLRSGLSTLGIVIGVSAVMIAMALGNGARDAIAKQISSLGSNLLFVQPGPRSVAGVRQQAGATSRLSRNDANEIMAQVGNITGAAALVRSRVQVVYLDKNANTEMIGTTPEYFPIHDQEILVGRCFDADDDLTRNRVAVIGMTVVKELFAQDENPVGDYVKINHIIFQVIGVLKSKGVSGPRDEDDIIIAPLATVMHRISGVNYVDSIDVQATSADKVDGAADALSRVLAKLHPAALSQGAGFRVNNFASVQQTVLRVIGTMGAVLAGVAAISLIVGGVGIMNIMLVSVTERTREIGLRKALGAKRRDILAQFLIEAVTVSMLGGLGGIFFGWAATTIGTSFTGFELPISPFAIILAVTSSATIGVVFGIWPARKASQLRPIDALRFE